MSELLQDVAAWATKQPGSDEDDDGVGCWSAVRISQLDINGQNPSLVLPYVLDLRGARKGSMSRCCFSSSAAEGQRQTWDCTLLQTRPALPSRMLQD